MAKQEVEEPTDQQQTLQPKPIVKTINNTKQIVVPWSFVRCLMTTPWKNMASSGILVRHPSGIDMTTTRMFQKMFKLDSL